MQLFFGLILFILHAGVTNGQNSTNTTASDLLVSALKSLGLDAVAGAIDLLADSPQFQPFINEIGAGNKTLFVPTNFTLSEMQSFASDIPNAVRILDYHVARGQISPSTAPVSPNHAVASTLLTDATVVLLKGGDAQSLVATKQDDGKLHILNQPTDVAVSQSQTVASLNTVINVVDNFLVFPGNISTTLSSRSLTQFQANLKKTGLLDTLSSERGVTIFAPSDSAFASASSALASLDNATLTTILQNHVINTTLYSTGLGTEQFTVTGQTLHVSNGTISAGKSTAKLSQTDIGLQNGVIHVIDTVLMDKSTGPSNGANNIVVCAMSPIVVSMFILVTVLLTL